MLCFTPALRSVNVRVGLGSTNRGKTGVMQKHNLAILGLVAWAISVCGDENENGEIGGAKTGGGSLATGVAVAWLLSKICWKQ